MSPRPRKVSDDQVFAATHRAMQRLGPRDLTLGEIAKEAGVTAGALVQRFGSRRALLLTLTRAWAGSSGEMIRQLHERHGTALGTLRAYAECLAELAGSPAVLVRNLAYLQIDLTDPDFRKHLEVHARATREGLKNLIAAGIRDGELIRSAQPAGLARTLEAVLGGSMLSWAYYREGTAARWMRDDVEAVLAPYLAAGKARRRRK